MGIPHLITFLRPYANHEPLAGRDVVIDGPGLSYHIYHLCLGKRPTARNAFEAVPSYEELGETAISWLDELRRSDVTIQRIYFDGHLPPSKLNVRLERLRTLTRRLNDYYHANPAPCRVSSLVQESKYESLFDHAAVRFSSTTFPAAPFLVPMIIDALGNSESYKKVVEVIPGEADLYCARYLKQHGGLVITGDSDLLIHDLGGDGSVCFFKDIRPLLDMKSGALSCSIFHSVAIADRLTLPRSHGLRALAFEMVMDSQGSFRRLLAQAISLKAVNTYEDHYADFLKEYEAPLAGTADSRNSGSEYPSAFMKVLRKLDPRVSEYVLQFPSIARCTDNETLADPPQTGSLQVFLPFLVDCPIRTTAWEISTSLRQLAYGLVKSIVPKDEQEYSVFEHRRQNNMNGKGYRLPNIPVIHETCLALISLIDQVHEKFSSLSAPDRWIAFAVCQEVAWSTSMARTIQGNLVAKELTTVQVETDSHTSCSWNTVQFLAQVQGVFYSLRMLQQITLLLICFDHARPCMEGVSTLNDRLKSLPLLSNIPKLTSGLSLIHKIETERMVQAAHDILGIKQESLLEEIYQPSKNMKKRNKTDRCLVSISHKKRQGNNSFELLNLE